MSFGSGFGGFGQNTNNNTANQSSGGFGGFGTPNNNTAATSGFGSSNTGGFGQTNNSGGLFGGTNNAAATTSTFGSSTGGFGSNATTGGFGSKPAFGGTTNTGGAGLFGSPAANTTTTSGFGGFGSNNNTAATAAPSAFGGGNTSGGSMFGNTANKAGFGTTATTGGSLFGGGGATSNTSGFGGGFGSSNTTLTGGGVGDPPGTGATPFQAHTEKEPNSTSNQSNSFQNILFQEPYKKWSSEELRLADYVQGRRHGNATGGGAFGVSSGFGGGFGTNTNTNTNPTSGFGATATNTTGGLFGNNTATATPASGFGNTGTSGFGNNTATNTTGGLFGQTANKPAGGLFGNNTTQQNQAGGGLFGGGNTTGGFGNTNTAGGFGATNAANTGGLFGASNNQPKPATGFSFGGTGAAATATPSAFGNTANNGFGASNNNTGGSLFGNTNNNQAAGGSLFGGNNQQQQQPQQQNASGGLFGQPNQTQQTGGLFGNNQQKPAGTSLFGNSPANAAGGGLFGNSTQQQNTAGFGTANAANAGGGLFGSKPAAGGGLFGNSTATQNTGGTGMFGGLGSNNQNQQQAGGSLFGSVNNQQQKPGLFGSTNQSPGTGLFGGQNNQAQGTSMFGNSTNQQQQMGNSILGNSQASNAPQGLTANLNDVSAYGTPSLFVGLSGTEVQNPGPLATPLNGSSKPRRSSILPMYKLAPASASRFATPQKRGFGFSYSTYGTPSGSPASSISSTPGTLGRSLLGSSSSGSLSKSMSTNNLRRSFNTEDSILAPGAFSSGSQPRWYGSTGSKKLVINRDIRSDLFSTPQKDKAVDNNGSARKLSKRVSFDTSNVDSDEGTPVRSSLLAPEDIATSPADETPRQTRVTNGSSGSKTPEMEEAKGKELAIVHEEDHSATPEASVLNGFDGTPGQYWMQPPQEDLENMNRMQRQKVDGFTVGRDNVGYVSFRVPVDLSTINLEEICGGLIVLEPRSATVYPVSAKKPPVGKGLNVPARISLEQSWPRGNRDKRIATDVKRFNKHIERLKRIENTTFESYDKETGVWVFCVEHFTTYGLDDSDDSDDELDVARPEPVSLQQMALNLSVGSPMEDDTFDFGRRTALPGTYDEPGAAFVADFTSKPSFLGVSSADSAPNDVRLSLDDEYTADMGQEYDMSDDEEIARSSPGQHLAAEHNDASSENGQEEAKATPGGILRARMRAVKDSAGPVTLEVADGDDWAEMLRKTVSPVKRDRQLLREMNDSPSKQTGLLIDFDKNDGGSLRRSIWKKSTAKNDMFDGFATNPQLGMDKGRGFATSIDLMNSLFEKPKPAPQNLRASIPGKGFPKWPYERQDKTLTMDEDLKTFHDSGRPTWGPRETLVLTRPLVPANGRRLASHSDILTFQRSNIQSEKQELRMATFATDSSKKFLGSQDKLTEIRLTDGVPGALFKAASLKDTFHHQDMNDPASIQEKHVWDLASILFDKVDAHNSKPTHLLRKAKLSQFWTDLVEHASSTTISLAGSSEEKAVACLAGHRVPEACKHLLDGKNFRLGTLVPLIGTNDQAKKDMREQLKAWHDSKMLSEFSEPIRTIYELLSGNSCVCEGMKGVPVEDRLDSFVISKKFGLDWKQSFGLRLWYGIGQGDDLAAAVKRFKNDIEQEREYQPLPWYIDQGIKPLWDDVDSDRRQDLLWGLLQLYAEDSSDLEAILRPENSQLSPLDMRLSWQLGLALVSTGRVSYGQNGTEKADAAAIAYASQLTSAGEWLEAVFVLLHLSNPVARAKAIQDHLCRHAGLIGAETSPAFGILVNKFHIPLSWIWEALALYMRSVKKDAYAEVQCLLCASSFVEAHRVLVQEVAPLAMVERDYANLSALISQFDGRHEAISEWSLGGEIYSLFLNLLQSRSKGEAPSPAVLERLLAGLHAMNENAPDSEILRYAAVSDMADETAKEILKATKKKQDVELRSRILNLPLTQDRLLAYSVDLSMDRYREPKNWPESFPYLRTPLHDKSLTPSHLQKLQTKPTPNSEGSGDMTIIPTSAITTPSALVRIQTIATTSHPAKGQCGLFATQNLAAGSFIMPYLGRVHSGAASAADSDYDLWLDRGADAAVDAASEGNEGRYVNDFRGVRERANAEFRTVWCERFGELCVGVWVVGGGGKKKGKQRQQKKSGKARIKEKIKGKGARMEGIKKGEEICVSYGKGFWDERRTELEFDEEQEEEEEHLEDQDKGIPCEAVAEFAKIVKAVCNVNCDVLHRDPISLRRKEATSEKPMDDTDSTPGVYPDFAPLQAPQNLTKPRLGRAPRGGIYNLATLRSRPSWNDESKVATTGGDTPRMMDLDNRSSSSSIPSMESPRLEMESYYIFNPRSTGPAYHLYRATDDEANTEAEFQVNKVPMTLIPHETGEFSCKIGSSRKDRGSSTSKSRETLWPPQTSEGLLATFQTVKTSSTGSNKTTLVDRNTSCTPGVETPSSLVGDNIGGIDLEIPPSIMAKVNERLRAQRQLRDRVHVIDDGGRRVPGTNNMFLVGNSDIRDVVSIVIQEMRQFKPHDSKWAGGINTNPGSCSLPKLDGIINMLLPQPATVADPATTISLPRTSYTSLSASDLQVHTKVRGLESETTTTIISRKSVTEITWPLNRCPGHSIEVCNTSSYSRAVSECSSPTHRASTPSSSRHSQSILAGSRFILNHYTTPNNTEDPLPDEFPGCSSQQNRSTSDLTGITSFPRLLSRHCTNEWVTPVARIDELMQPTPDTLYHCGVDAQCGSVSGPSSSFLQEPLKTRHCNHDMFGKNPFCTDPNQQEAVGETELPPLPDIYKRVGASIGSASHRRRSSQPPTSPNPGVDSNDKVLPSFMEKIRQGSHKIFHRHHSQKGSEEAAGLPNSEDHLQRREPRSTDSLEKHPAAGTPKLESGSVKEAMVGTGLVVTRCRKGTCSEDNRPHTCANDFLTPPRAGSPP
ncbi:Nucleoporin [Neonectria ditissima]|uniref:Nucleoporin n=1 Tax=Neonectria ditissima TaxID=78410 RepID=A0A0P7BNE0_9HYPO|nr:Nucleoporin [Neonectria ditissima]